MQHGFYRPNAVTVAQLKASKHLMVMMSVRQKQ